MAMFQTGGQRVSTQYQKRYHPFLYRIGQRRYAGRGRTFFRTMTAAQEYAARWAERAARFVRTEKENNHVND